MSKIVKLRNKEVKIKMPWMPAKRIELSEKEKTILSKLSEGTHTQLHLKIRAKIIIMASENISSNAISKELNILHGTVRRWRNRYIAQNGEIREVESKTPHKMRGTIERILSDEQRPGSPAIFNDHQVAAIIAMSCESPEKFDLPFSHWTPELLQIEAIKLGIVDSISVRQIGRFLKRERFATAQESVLVES